MINYPVDLSIIIPAFEEQQKIGRDIEAAAAFLERQELAGEIIVVDDGSRDDTAAAAGRITTPPDIPVQVIRYADHRGKGYAIRTGMQQARGDYVMFADSGNCVPYDHALRGLRLLKSGACELAHGSRKLPESHTERRQVWYRRILSKGFHWAMILGMGLPRSLTDTQCGFKIYRGDVARTLYGQCATDGFMFDIEIILRARQQGYRIKEFPIAWTADPDTRLSVTRTSRTVLTELWAIKRSLAAS